MGRLHPGGALASLEVSEGALLILKQCHRLSSSPLDFKITPPKFARSFGPHKKLLSPSMLRSAFFKKLAFLFLIIVVWEGRGGVFAQEVLDGIAAVVNGDVITFSQVREVVGTREKALRGAFTGNELVEKIKETRLAAVKELIDRQLILQEFKKNKLSIPDYVIEDRVQTIIREEFGGDRQAFTRTLEAQGYTLSRFKEIETEKVIVQAMRGRVVKSEAIISPHQIDDYYAKHRAEFSTPEQVKLRMIVIKKNGDNGVKMAEEIRQKVADGGDFAKLAQMYSEDSTQESGGDWGWIDRKTLNENLTEIAFSLKPGSVSKVAEAGGNCYILFVEAKKPATVKPLSEMRDEIEKKLQQEERQRLQQKWIDGLRKKAYIKMF